MAEAKLETLNLGVGYDGRLLIGDISLEVHPGEILTLIGPNGAGKSTVLKSIAGQLAPIRGTVLLCGEDMAAAGRMEIARLMSVLFTDRNRAELMTCLDVASAGRYPYTGRLGILDEKDRQIVRETLELVGGWDMRDRPFDAVSDGQRQRILLARALIQQPEVLLLDEPTSYLDIRYKLEFLTTLRKLVKERGLSVIMSMHELDLAMRMSDRVVCVAGDRIDRIGRPEECFDRSYLAKLFDMEPGSFDPCFDTLEYGPGPAGVPAFEHYVTSGGKRLRCGYTTGTCAALAASGAARRLLLGIWPDTVRLITPGGLPVETILEEKTEGKDFAACGVRKDGGDDIDHTSGALICVRVEKNDLGELRIEGGEGVGRVTKPGLDQPVGEAAINSVPRRMIAGAVEQIAELAGYAGGITVTVFVPDGGAIAEKTFNPALGIEGGISILGTSGIVEPMSSQALIDTIRLEIRQAAALGNRRLILTPGNYGLDFLRGRGLDALGIPVVKCSNFLGDAIDEAAEQGFLQILLVGHAGKLVKLAAGIMNTHSRQADCRTELFCAHAAICGADREVCERLMTAATSDACLDILKETGLDEPVMESLLAAIEVHLARRAGAECRIGAVLFSNQHGLLGTTQEAEKLLKQWR